MHALGAVVNGQYELRERIAEGGMGVVYRAHQLALARPVAIKFLHRRLGAAHDLEARFQQEARAASRVSHPNAVTVIDFGFTQDATPFMVMEYVRGVTLTHLLRAEAPISVARAVDLVGQILSALGEAHDVGVVHADVKSENVLVETVAGGADLVKVIDFGLARLRGADDDLGPAVSGTPEYMAPELMTGAPPSPASDLYAVGVILYEALTGAPPFTGERPLDVMCRHAQDLVVPPSLRAPDRDIPSAVEQACLRALAKDPRERFATAATFADALDDGLPVPDLAPPSRCPACGAAHARGRFCPDCGASGIPVEAVRDEATAPVVAPPAGVRWPPAAPASVEVRLRRLRGDVADAIVRDDANEAIARLLELTRALAGRGHEAAAIAELEEGIDALSGGSGAEVAAAPRGLWRLLLALARLRARTGDRERAERLTIAALGRAHG